MKLEWTILLLRPDYTADNYGQDTYQTVITAPTAARALELARKEACGIDNNDLEHKEDYYCLSCIPGMHIDLSDGNGGVI
jgi:hypothetical protein